MAATNFASSSRLGDYILSTVTLRISSKYYRVYTHSYIGSNGAYIFIESTNNLKRYCVNIATISIVCNEYQKTLLRNIIDESYKHRKFFTTNNVNVIVDNYGAICKTVYLINLKGPKYNCPGITVIGPKNMIGAKQLKCFSFGL